jgi:hypothetical protein
MMPAGGRGPGIAHSPEADTQHWIIQRLNYRTPIQARRDFSLESKLAA